MRIFLDFDGVLNDHRKMENGYSGVCEPCRGALNRLMAAAPQAHIVVISAWRYMVLSGSMTLGGFENLMLTHGLHIWGRLAAVTESDEATAAKMGKPQADFSDEKAWHRWVHAHGCAIRQRQILDYVAAADDGLPFVVLDDLDLGLPQQVVTRYDVGLTMDDVNVALIVLRTNQALDAGAATG